MQIGLNKAKQIQPDLKSNPLRLSGISNNKIKRDYTKSNQDDIKKSVQTKPMFDRTRKVFNWIGYNLKGSIWRSRFNTLKYHTLYHFLPFVVIGIVTIRVAGYLLFGDYNLEQNKFIASFKKGIENKTDKDRTDIDIKTMDKNDKT